MAGSPARDIVGGAMDVVESTTATIGGTPTWSSIKTGD